nr:bactericidal permeability-increasing protein-like [Misgurnus anguillicaudatus]XP_055071343.1 bactericidal permeability-increasing protein-like [Misgurnus anguillicaudatus]
MMRLFVFFLLMLTQTCSAYPALKVQLLHKSLTDGSQMMSVWIQQKLKSTEIADVHGKLDILIGTVDYTLSNIWIRQSSMSDLVMEFVEGTGVSVMVSQLSLAVTGDWATHFGLIHDGGSFDLAVHNININLLLLFSDDESGRLFISSVSCTDDVGGVDVTFHGGASVLFKPFDSKIRGIIVNTIREQICPTIKQVIDDVEMHLQEMPVKVAVDQYIDLSIPLTSSPFVTNDNIQLDIKGEFYSKNSPSEPPFYAQDFDLQYTDDYMISLGVSEFFINSAAFSYFSSGVFQINIKDDMIPKSLPIHLNTRQFSIFIPQLATLYPDTEMQVLLYASETPLFFFNPGELDLHVPASAKFSAVKQDGSLIPLFRLDVDGFFSGNAQIENKRLTGAVKMNNLTLNLGSSEIGDFKTAPLEQAIKMAMSMFVLPKLNEKLKNGIPLPVLKDFSLINTNMLIKNGFVIILTDVETTPGNLSIFFWD